MSLSFLPTRAALVLWWAMLWRSFAWAVVWLIPMMLITFLLLFSISLPLLIMGMDEEGTKQVVSLVALMVKGVAYPIFMMSFVFWRLFRKGRLGRYAISGTYRAEDAKTFKTSLFFGFFTYLEMMRYSWPLFVMSMFIGVVAELELLRGIVGASAITVLASFFIHFLVLSDLIQRQTYNRCTLKVEKV